MEHFILMELIFTYILVLHISIESLVQGQFLQLPAEPFTSEMKFHGIHTNFNPHLDFEIGNKFFTNYNDEITEVDSTSINEKNNNIKEIGVKLKKIKDYRHMLHEKENSTSEVKKITKPKLYEQKKLHLLLTGIKSHEDEIIMPKDTQILEINAEDIPFVPTWPKHVENPMRYTPSLLKFVKKMHATDTNFASSTNEHENNKKATIISDLVDINLKREPKSIKINPEKLILGSKANFITETFASSLLKSKQKEVSEKLKMTAEESSNQINKIFIPRQFQSQKRNEELTPQMVKNKDQQNEVNKPSFEINDTLKNNANYAQFENHNQQTPELSTYSFVPAFESKLEETPWNLYKDRRFLDIKPFPELHSSGIMHREKSSSEIQKTFILKKALPLNEEQKNQEIAGPVLYPKSSFIKEFHVPFFV